MSNFGGLMITHSRCTHCQCLPVASCKNLKMTLLKSAVFNIAYFHSVALTQKQLNTF